MAHQSIRMVPSRLGRDTPYSRNSNSSMSIHLHVSLCICAVTLLFVYPWMCDTGRKVLYLSLLSNIFVKKN